MALTAVIDETVTPAELTITSDRRLVTITSAGDTATATFPIKISGSPVTWTPVSDDGKTAVYSTTA
jgi:hypothetical protein